jgi:tRNA pseudouridine65 synthase
MCQLSNPVAAKLSRLLNKACFIVEADNNGLFAVFKPPSVLSHPNNVDSGIKKSLLLAHYDHNRECFVAGDTIFWLIHRLDSATSGLVLISSSEAIAKAVKREFSYRSVFKS